MLVTDHPEHPVTGEDSNVLQAENYQDLVNDVLYFVKQGMDSGVIRLTNYPRDVETDLNNACLEVARDAPLGAYAVDYIEHDCTRVVKYMKPPSTSPTAAPRSRSRASRTSPAAAPSARSSRKN